MQSHEHLVLADVGNDDGRSAQDAAQQYEYQPTLLNGVAVEVVTTVDVDFRLAQ